jgi:hypothetical protein
LYDNEEDPFQQQNLLVGRNWTELLGELDDWLQRKLDERGDEFLPGMEYIRRWGYPVDARGTVPYTN